jgi:hypothetical protein
LRINGEILSRNKTVAVVRDGLIISSDAELLPLYLKRTGDVEGWLESRAIDTHRTNSRLLKKALRLTNADDAALVLKVNAVTITDTYWFREANSALRYDDVRFKVNYFDKLALRGDADSFNQPYSPTPELTNIGSFEKCWRLENTKWWMIKLGNQLERFSELFVCELGKALSFPMAEYFAEDGTIKSPDFTDGASVNYEPMHSLIGDDEDYSNNYKLLMTLSPELAEQYLQIIYMDTLCFNMDRHTMNYGVLRDVDSGKILSMAPNFDNNIALFARGIPKLGRANDKLIELFCELLTQNESAFETAKRLPVPTEDIIYKCIETIKSPEHFKDVLAFIMNGSSKIQNCIHSK